jgi:hypothetical protein
MDHFRTRRGRSPSLPCNPVALVPTARFCGLSHPINEAKNGNSTPVAANARPKVYVTPEYFRR